MIYLLHTQYWLPNVGSANASSRPKFKLEYLTYALPSLHPGGTVGDGLDEGKEKETFVYPVPVRELPKSLRAPNATRSKSKYAPYTMADLTIGSWLRLARKLGDKKRAKVRTRFRKYMYMGGDEK